MITTDVTNHFHYCFIGYIHFKGFEYSITRIIYYLILKMYILKKNQSVDDTSEPLDL